MLNIWNEKIHKMAQLFVSVFLNFEGSLLQFMNESTEWNYLNNTIQMTKQSLTCELLVRFRMSYDFGSKRESPVSALTQSTSYLRQTRMI